MIEIRQSETGESKHFHGKQEIADFLAEREDAASWTGHEGLGELPAPTATVTEPEAAESTEAPEAPEAEETPGEPETSAPAEAAPPAAKTIKARATEAVKAVAKKARGK